MNNNQFPIAMFAAGLRDGGAERVIVNLARGFSELGHGVDLVFAQLDEEGPYIDEARRYARIVNLKAGRTIRALLPLASYLKTRQPRVLISHITHCNVVALFARRLSRTFIPLSVVEHNVISEKRHEAPATRGPVVYRLAKKSYPWADLIVGVSAGVADDLAATLDLPRDRVKVIYNPIVAPDIVRKAQEKVGHPFFQTGAPAVVLGAGRLCPQKDFLTLLHAFKIVRDNRPARLIILGEGEDRAMLQAAAKGLGVETDSSFPGFVDNIFAYMARSSVFVLSSRHEGLPSVLIEALACGTPVVSTDCPSGPNEILDKGRYGRLVPVGDADAMAHAIQETLDQPRDTETLRNCASRFSTEKIAKDYLRVLDK